MVKTQAQNSLPAIGAWREHLPYNSAIDVTAGDNKIYCATPYSLFTVDLADNSLERLSKITGLSETGISTINYNESKQRLLIAYNNSNIDIIYRHDVFNIPDLKRKVINGDKSVYNVYSLGSNFYLSTGIGIVVIDGDKYEIKESWILGNNGSNTKVTGFTSDANNFYAATDEGLKRTSINTANPANYLNWTLVSGNFGLTAGPCADVVTVNNRIVVLKNDSLFILNGTDWSLLYADGNKITSIKSSGSKILVCQAGASAGKVVVLNSDGSLARTIQQDQLTTLPRKAILYNNNFWIADQQHALLKFSTSPVADEVFRPNSPDGIANGEMLEHNNIFYAAAGGVNNLWVGNHDENGIYRLRDGEWKSYNRFHYSILDSMFDFLAVAIDPGDESVWAGSFGGGLLHIKPNESFDIFKQSSLVKAATFDPLSYRVSGLQFDKRNNLWISNFGALQPLVVRKQDGSWKSFLPPFTLAENALSQIAIDPADQIWIVSPLSNGLVCYSPGSSIDDVNDDHWKLYRTGAGSGNLPSNNVLCVAVDKSGFIWIGTDDGIAIVQCPGEVFTTGCDAIIPVVQQGNFAGFLFKGENVRSIAVDGADRKWVATNNGVWLISADGEKVVERLTENNGPLLSNDVKKISINGKTGEVYFATANGICSFRGTATEGSETNSGVLVFPNPVPPGYPGAIAIKGVAENSIVKITELDGRLVYQARALGGQAIWNGEDYKGRKISSGIYLVLVSTDDKREKMVTKIVFISQ